MVLNIIAVINIVIFVVSIVVELWALIHCALQRNDAFNAIGTLSKGMWLAILGGTILLSFILAFSMFGQMFVLLALTAALVYLLDIRPAIRDITSGGGGW